MTATAAPGCRAGRTGPPPSSGHTVPRAALTRLVELACAAPSTHNTQPWRWRLADDGLELHADPRRRLPATDPDDRDLVVSCGAALHHARVAARALGWQPAVDRLPDPGEPTLLARVTLAPRPPGPGDAAGLEALLARCTDRRRFTSWPVPADRLDRLVAVAAQQGATAVAVADAVARFRLERLVQRAESVQDADPTAVDEQRQWVGERPDDGVPLGVVPATSTGRPVRFGTGLLDQPRRDVRGSDGVVVLGGADDHPASWLRTGEALSALWLEATADGLSVVPLSQPIEVAETRAELRHAVVGDALVPHLLVRLGWQAIGRSELPRTPRRPVADVLLP